MTALLCACCLGSGQTSMTRLCSEASAISLPIIQAKFAARSVLTCWAQAVLLTSSLAQQSTGTALFSCSSGRLLGFSTKARRCRSLPRYTYHAAGGGPAASTECFAGFPEVDWRLAGGQPCQLTFGWFEEVFQTQSTVKESEDRLCLLTMTMMLHECSCPAGFASF